MERRYEYQCDYCGAEDTAENPTFSCNPYPGGSMWICENCWEKETQEDSARAESEQ